MSHGVNVLAALDNEHLPDRLSAEPKGGVSPRGKDPVFSVDEGLLRRARELVLRKDTSVNARVRDFLTRDVEARSRRPQSLDALLRGMAVSVGRSHQLLCRHRRPLEAAA
jgi:hypothetical protein